jgi:DNA-nicking Smr family endonuclease
MVKKLKHQQSDEHLFRQEMDGVVPLKAQTTTNSKTPRVQFRKRKPEPVSASFDQVLMQSTADQLHIDAEDGSSHRKNGVQKKILQKLKRGRFTVGEQLDLHNMTLETAHMALLEFVEEAQSDSIDCIRIIHGKGLRSGNGPRLKLMTQQFMREHPQVLAFNSCKPADGGTGAMDVLLKKT